MAEEKKVVKAKTKKNNYYGTGRRKQSVARVRLYENGKGNIIINDKNIDEYFGLETLKLIVKLGYSITK